MITFPQHQSPSESSETLTHLNKVRLELLRQLDLQEENRQDADQPSEHSGQRFSLFSSPRNYREDELANGLNDDGGLTEFGKN